MHQMLKYQVGYRYCFLQCPITAFSRSMLQNLPLLCNKFVYGQLPQKTPVLVLPDHCNCGTHQVILKNLRKRPTLH